MAVRRTLRSNLPLLVAILHLGSLIEQMSKGLTDRKSFILNFEENERQDALGALLGGDSQFWLHSSSSGCRCRILPKMVTVNRKR